MQQFLHDLGGFVFLRAAVTAGLLASIPCGIVGTYVVVRRRSYIAGAIAHCVLGGMGAARYLRTVHDVTWLTPLVGAAAAALFSAVLIGIVTSFTEQREDTVLSLVWALGMAIGVSFIAATPGYNEDLMSYLFGNILMVARQDLWLMAGLNIVVLVLTALFYNKLLVVCFHEELARLRGLRVGLYNIVLLLLTALTVVLLVQVVGIVMVIALLTLPAATATHFGSRLWQVMAAAVVLTVTVTLGGLAMSYAPGWPAGATIIELAAVVYLLTLLGHGCWRRLQQRRSRRAGAGNGDAQT